MRRTAPRGDVVEFYNTGPMPVDLTGWILTDLDADPIAGVMQDATFAPGFLGVDPLQPGEFAVIDFVDAAGTASWHPTNYGLRIVAPLEAGSFLGSERDELLLADAADTPVDFVAWADTTTVVTADSYEDLSAVTGVVFDYGLTPDKDGDERDRLIRKWTNGAATDLSDFADPVSGSAVYQVCVYDFSLAPQPLLDAGAGGSGVCGGKDCWRTLGTKGYAYKDKAGIADGLLSLKLKSGIDGKAKILVKAGGLNLDFAALPYTSPVIVQMLIDDGNTIECWQTSFVNVPIKNDASAFKAKQ